MAARALLSWLTSSRDGSNPVSRPVTTARRPVRRRFLGVEALEDRSVPAVLVVNSLQDLAVDLNDATVTLRDAIHAAENDVAVSPDGPAGSGADTITFDAALLTSGPETINLTIIGDSGDMPDSASSQSNGEGLAGNSAFRVATTVTIQGPTGANGLTLSAPGDIGAREEMRHFRIDSTGNLTLDNLRLTGGSVDMVVDPDSPVELTPYRSGGSLLNFGTLKLQNCVVTGNNSIGGFAGLSGGGGIANFGNDADRGFESVGALAVLDSVISNNSLRYHFEDEDGAVFEGEDALGGGILNSLGTAVVTGSEIAGNTAG